MSSCPFLFALESISQLFGLHIVLCPMKHFYYLWDVSSVFSFIFILDCLSEKEIVALAKVVFFSRPVS